MFSFPRLELWVSRSENENDYWVTQFEPHFRLKSHDEKPLLLLSLHGEIACRFINAQYKTVVAWQWLSGCQPVILITSWIYIALFHSKRSHCNHYSFTLVALSYMCRLTEASWLPQSVYSHWQCGFKCTWRQRPGWSGGSNRQPFGLLDHGWEGKTARTFDQD